MHYRRKPKRILKRIERVCFYCKGMAIVLKDVMTRKALAYACTACDTVMGDEALLYRLRNRIFHELEMPSAIAAESEARLRALQAFRRKEEWWGEAGFTLAKIAVRGGAVGVCLLTVFAVVWGVKSAFDHFGFFETVFGGAIIMGFIIGACEDAPRRSR